MGAACLLCDGCLSMCNQPLWVGLLPGLKVHPVQWLQLPIMSKITSNLFGLTHYT